VGAQIGVLRLHGLGMAAYRGATSDAVGGAALGAVLLAGRASLGAAIAADLADLAAVAGLAGALAVGELALDAAGEVAVGVGQTEAVGLLLLVLVLLGMGMGRVMVVALGRGRALDALGLCGYGGGEVRVVVVQGPLRGHDGRAENTELRRTRANTRPGGS
jgi:hypothetical protein